MSQFQENLQTYRRTDATTDARTDGKTDRPYCIGPSDRGRGSKKDQAW